MKALFSTFCALACAVTAFAGPPDETARQFVELLVASPVQGLPSKDQMKTYGPMMTDELNRLIGEARAEQEDFQKKNPEEKPPWIEGALFSSLFEGVTRFRLGEGTTQREFFTVPVYWEYTEGNETSRWIDLLILRREGDTWKVRDVIYGAPWDFRPGPSLRSVLQERE